eukprot:gene3869-4412_t
MASRIWLTHYFVLLPESIMQFSKEALSGKQANAKQRHGSDDCHIAVKPVTQRNIQIHQNINEQSENDSDDSVTLDDNVDGQDNNARYLMRQRRKPEHLNDYVTEEEVFDVMNLSMDVINNVSDTPATYEDAINSPDSRKWKNAMNEEFNSLKENNTFTFTPLPKDKNAVGGRWV